MISQSHNLWTIPSRRWHDKVQWSVISVNMSSTVNNSAATAAAWHLFMALVQSAINIQRSKIPFDRHTSITYSRTKIMPRAKVWRRKKQMSRTLMHHVTNHSSKTAKMTTTHITYILTNVHISFCQTTRKLQITRKLANFNRNHISIF